MVNRVFLVSDDVIFRRSLRTYLLTQDDFSVCGETNYRAEAILEAMKLQPDLAVLEISAGADLEVARMFGLLIPELPVFLVAEQFSLAIEKKALSYRVRAVFPLEDDFSAIVLNAREICA
jgi:DNA-binding NarL/FixJ family response regulator